MPFYTIKQRLYLIAAVLIFTIYFSCSIWQPEVVIINRTAEHILIANPSFNGVRWNKILRYNQATDPKQCLRGSDKVHFQKFDAEWYCRRQVEYGMIDSLCMCDTTWINKDTTIINSAPIFFNYQSISVKQVKSGNFHIFEITLDDMEQDFTVPGPYGH